MASNSRSKWLFDIYDSCLAKYQKQHALFCFSFENAKEKEKHIWKQQKETLPLHTFEQPREIKTQGC